MRIKELGLLSGVFFLLAGPVHAQGMMPGSKPPSEVLESSAALKIGEAVSGNIAVLDAERNPRTLRAYKSSLQLLVVAFVSRECPADEKAWRLMRRLEEDYRDWRVAFVAINPTKGDSIASMQEDFKRRKLAWPLARDPEGEVARMFHIQKLPTLLIIDESGYLQYRGPLDKAEAALKTVIAHIDPLVEPEPPVMEGCSL